MSTTAQLSSGGRPAAAVAKSMAALRALLAAGGIELEDDDRRLTEYSYDASNYRVRPLGVIFPRTAEQVAAAVRACTAQNFPVIVRGGGTGMAGGGLGAAIVLDLSRHLHRIDPVAPDGNSVRAEAGVVLSHLTDAVESATGGTRTFAPDPSSRTRACVGGAIGNDACGNHSVRYGRTEDHVLALEIVTAEGHRLLAETGGLSAIDPADRAAVARAAEITESLRELASGNLGMLRTELERLPRQVSGFHLARLLPEHGFDAARALVGSEGTCAIVTAAHLRVVEKAPTALLVCLGYPDVVAAAEDVMTILEYSPAAIEGIDEAIVATMRARRGDDAVAALPDGKAWLFVDLDGEDPDAVAAEAGRLLARLAENGRLAGGAIVPDAAARASLWRVREAGAGLATRLVGGADSLPGWEDSAVPPEHLADYLRDILALLTRHELLGVVYGHFGAGCLHIRITFDLRSTVGIAIYRAFCTEAARIVARHGGSISGEHGDGRARSELLGAMYSPEMLALFARFARIWDPERRFGGSSIVDPAPIDRDLALDGVPARDWRPSFALTPVNAPADAGRGDASHQHGSADPFALAVQGCVGVGSCRTTSGGVMCPSYRATRDEKDSTRGRARVLQEMVRSAPSVRAGWRSEAVADALDLCLGCKACKSDCPVGVDMATYRSEHLDHRYRGRIRPIAHYSMGWLPRWLRLIRRVRPAAVIVNAVLASPLKTIVARTGGISTRRRLPRFATPDSIEQELADVGVPATDREEASAVLFVDSFTRGFRPHVAAAAGRVLASAGRTSTCEADQCCGLTWISTGQLATARRLLTKTVAALDDGSDRDIVVLEPSCASAIAHDGPELLGTDAARRVASRIRTFPQVITAAVGAGWTPPTGVPAAVTVQTHCHEYATFGATTQSRALAAIGVASVREATGCCGVAGNFGFEARHHDVSMAVAEQALAPALRATDPQTPVLADGFSCQMQIAQLDPGRTPLHLAELLDPLPPAQKR